MRLRAGSTVKRGTDSRHSCAAAVAIPSNVSEGHQQGTKAYLHFVIMALGSLAEAETQIELARRLRLTADDELGSVADLAGHVRRVLHGLRRSLAARLDP